MQDFEDIQWMGRGRWSVGDSMWKSNSQLFKLKMGIVLFFETGRKHIGALILEGLVFFFIELID